MQKTDTIERPALELEKLEANSLPELRGWREKQLAVVKENPFVAIKDHKTYESAKKSRTALVTARTSIQNQEKTIASKIKAFRDKVGEVSKELIAITQPHETKQQEEVRRYESEKEAERQERERIEQERRDKIKKQIETAYASIKAGINSLTYEEIEAFTSEGFPDCIEAQGKVDMEEFDLDWEEKKMLLNQLLDDKVKDLEDREAQRAEAERLAKEREALEAERKAMEASAEAAKKEAEAKEAESKKALEAEAAKLKAEREAVEAEKQRLKEAECERIRKESEEAKAKEEAEAKAKKDAELKARAEALRPDKEKLESFIESIGFMAEDPTLCQERAIEFMEIAQNRVHLLREELKNELSTL